MRWTSKADGPPLSLAALEAMRPAQRPADYFDQFERFGALLLRQRWVFASSMPQNPHFYTLRRDWERDADFVRAVTFLRMYGYTSYYMRRAYVQIDVNDHFYWTMGWPINRPDGSPCTILINRKRTEAPVPYDSVADQYDALFADPAHQTEDIELFDLIGSLADQDVLDVGCGTGLTLNMAREIDWLRYMGLDPSGRMLSRLRRQYPIPCVMQTKLASFVPPENPDGTLRRYDTLLALYGTGSYLSDEELARIPSLLKPGGRAFVMFYAPNYYPETYARTGLKVPYRPWEGQFQGMLAHRIGNHVLIMYQQRAAVPAPALAVEVNE